MATLDQRFAALGFERWHTGGGCWAWRRDGKGTSYTLVTNDGAHLPSPGGVTVVGDYTDWDDDRPQEKHYPSPEEYLRGVEAPLTPCKVCGNRYPSAQVRQLAGPISWVYEAWCDMCADEDSTCGYGATAELALAEWCTWQEG